MQGGLKGAHEPPFSGVKWKLALQVDSNEPPVHPRNFTVLTYVRCKLGQCNFSLVSRLYPWLEAA